MWVRPITSSQQSKMASPARNTTGMLSILFVLFATVSATGTTTSPFEEVFEDVASCKGDCDKTYPLHTYPEPNDLKACYRGCRLFSMLDFVEEVFNENFTDTMKECRDSCGEAYVDPSQLLACELGCSNQLPYAQALHRQWAEEESKVHLLIPVLSVQSLWRGLLDTYRGLSFSYWSVYMQDENGQVYVFESSPELDVFTLNPEANRVSARNWINAETNLQAFHPQTSTDINGQTGYDDSASWLECVSRKSGLPRWLLSMTLFLSVLALIWLCFVTLMTAPEQRISTPKLSIYGDLEYLKKGPVSPYPIYIQSMVGKKHPLPSRDDDDDDDEPLPLKVDISAQQSLI
ncbi:Transmembrane protein 59 [Holothuria leucospilota]|uniref:Transmembrane protein 59 n=1 Tax=Holothuria leucospilota TaxID=206669 RepID=A0A9Q1HCW7_HOLLE|nr:Transmembrane protein 59 [Holothuria leucospilota]